MLDASDRTDQLRNMKKPADLEDTFILTDMPSPLKLHTGLTDAEQAMLAPGRVYFHPKKTYKKSMRGNMWNVDLGSSAPGYFDESGNFILNKADKVSTLWFVKRGGTVEGPLTENEIKKAAETGALKDTQVKRDFDKGFVDSNGLLAALPAFYQSKSLNKYFVANQAAAERQTPDDFYSNVVTKERTSKLTNFLRSNNITASGDFLIKTIKGMTKQEAINAVRGITGLDRVENAILVELLVEDSSVQVLSDVDKDGFTTNSNNRGKKGFKKY